MKNKDICMLESKDKATPCIHNHVSIILMPTTIINILNWE